jgi:hypothetical protein
MKRAALSGLLCCLGVVLVPIASSQNASDIEKTAVSRMRTLNTAEVTYANTYKDRGFACDIAQLGGTEGQKPTPERAYLVDEKLASGHFNGYRFAVHCPDDHKPADEIRIVAVPEDASSGARAFCSEQHVWNNRGEGGLIWYSKDGKEESCFTSGIPIR